MEGGEKIRVFFLGLRWQDGSFSFYFWKMKVLNLVACGKYWKVVIFNVQKYVINWYFFMMRKVFDSNSIWTIKCIEIIFLKNMHNMNNQMHFNEKLYNAQKDKHERVLNKTCFFLVWGVKKKWPLWYNVLFYFHNDVSI